MVSSLLTRRLIALLGLSALWLLLSCVPALAHAQLLQTAPANGARLSQPPKQVRLGFNEPIEAEFSPLKVLDQQGDRVGSDDARVDPNDARVLTADLKELPEGSYTVEWRVVSADTHPVNGSFGFIVTGAGTGESQIAAQTGAENAEQSGEQSTDPTEPGTGVQQDTGGIYPHIFHIVGLGLGTLIFLALALLRLRR